MKNKIGLLVLLVAILIAESIFTGILPISRGYLFGILDTKVGPIWQAIFLYFMTYFSINFFQSIRGYFVLKLALWLRSDRTNAIKDKLNPAISNLPQRLQEDVKLSYHARLRVYCEYFVSGVILVQLVILNLTQPILIVASLSYAALSVLIALLFNKRLSFAEISSQHAEASYRADLVKDITNFTGLPIANKVLLKAQYLETQYLLFTQLQLGLITVLPYILLVPLLFSGAITLGQLMEHQATFGLLVVNAAILIQFYPVLIQGKASEFRVKEATND